MRSHFLLISALLLASCEGTEVSVSKTQNIAPGVVINSPTDGAQFLATELVDFIGVISDANGLTDVQVIQWNSSVQGELGTPELVQPDTSGTSRVSEVLQTGTHVITLTATDVAGESSQASISLVIGADDPEPTALIVKPTNFEVFYEGDPIPLEGLVADPQYPNEQLEVFWLATDEATQITTELSADYAQEDGSTVSAWTSAPVGSYTLTLEVTNPDGYSADDEAFILVGDPNDIDVDNDNYSPNQGDCDDNDATVYPGAPELADGKDNDCDGTADEGTELFDDDGDGYCESLTVPCTDGSLPGDCNDSNAAINPGATEACDSIDNDCDGITDEEDATYCDDYYYDGDQDNYGSDALYDSRCLCAPSSFFTASNGKDCDDTMSTVNPGITEIIGDEIDQDCDGQETCYIDTDGDGYVIDTLATILSVGDVTCDSPGEATQAQVSTVNDCNDADPSINPGETEIIGDETDQNCDGQESCYVDADGDDYIVDTLATIASSNSSCTDYGEATAAQLQAINDCNDTVGLGYAINPAALEGIGDEIDQNCDNQELCYVDGDGDTYIVDSLDTVVSTDLLCNGVGEALAIQLANTNDCNDSDDQSYPGANEEIGDGDDQDCDGEEVCYVDADGDGFIVDTLDTIVSTNLDCTDAGEAEASQLGLLNDCDDTISGVDIYPGAVEIVGDEIDQNCDTQEICYVDDDDDGFIIDSLDEVISNDILCDDSGEATDSQLETVNDCDDDDDLINPDAIEIPGDAIDQDCDGQEFCYNDADDDGYAEAGASYVASTDIDCQGTGLAPASQIVGLDDCDDNEPTVYPGATELIGDEIDQDCDGEEICYVDSDNDNFIIDTLATITSSDDRCDGIGEASASQLQTTNDCDDNNDLITPTSTELVGDGIDQNCDGEEQCYLDNDDDGYIPSSMATTQSTDLDCSDYQEANDSVLNLAYDCDDNNAAISPGAPEEIGNGQDENCDNQEDCYTDNDNDGYMNANMAIVQSSDMDCNDPGESYFTDGDCDDSSNGGYYINPGATENPGDGVDQNCDFLELCYADADGDNYIIDTLATVDSVDLDCTDFGEAEATQLTGQYDCDDTDPGVNPGESESPGDEIDQDCDGQELCYIDNDGDGYIIDSLNTINSADIDCSGSGEARSNQLSSPNDCNDNPGSGQDIYPGATEYIGDEVDSDCDGQELCYIDNDGDGFVNDSLATTISSNESCTDPGEGADYQIQSLNDCDDSNNGFAINPNAPEECGDNIDNDCNGSVDEEGALNCEDYYFDADSDGYGDGTPTCACSAPSSDWVTITDDCNDSSQAANPGQNSFFTSPQPSGSYDYNCDNIEEKYDTRTGAYTCQATTFFGVYISCTGTSGWITGSSSPSCGNSKTWIGSCYLIDSLSGCGWPANQSVQQSCR